jgi:predicted PurR-regulated permease PerM
MPPGSNTDPYRPLVVLGVVIATVFILSVASKVLIPIALGILLSFVLNGPVQYLISRGMRRLYAVWVVVAVTVLVVALLLAGLLVQMRDLADTLPTYRDNFREKVQAVFGKHEQTQDSTFSRLSRMLTELSEDLQGGAEVRKDVQPVRVVGDRWTGFGFLPILAGPVAGTLGSISLTIGLTVSMLLMRDDLRNRLFLLLGDGNLTSSTRAMDEVSQRISGYLTVQVILNASFGALFGIALAIIQVPYPLVWAVLAFCLRFVPYLGTWLSAIFPMLLAIGAKGWWQASAVGGIVFGLMVLFNSILEPMLVSRTVGVTPMALVISMAFWTWLWGPIGLVLSTPITVGLSVLGKYFPSLRYFDVMLGRAAPLEADLTLYQRLLARDEVEAADLLEQALAEPEQTAEGVLNDVVMPVLARARGDRERGQLTDVEVSELAQRVREIVDTALGEGEGEAPAEPAAVPAARLVACPASDELDRVAIELLGRHLPGGPAQVVTLSPGATAAEVVAKVREVNPAAVLLSVLPPAGAARARYLCKRLKAAMGDTPIVAGLWGRIEANDPLPVQLTAAGALHVATSLPEARSLVVPLLQVQPHLVQPAAPVAILVGEPERR